MPTHVGLKCLILIFGCFFWGIYLVCLEQAGHLIQIFLCPSTSPCLPLIRWIASSCFRDLFRTFPCSFIKSSCFWYHWYVCNMHDTPPDSRPFSARTHLSVSFFLSLIRWIGSSCSLALSGGFPVNFNLKHHVQRRSAFVPALPMSCHVFLLTEHLPVMTSHQPGVTPPQRWWVLAIMAVECPWLKEVGLRSGWVIALSLTFVKNKQSAISNNDQSTLTFDGRQIAHVQITTWWHANYYTIPRTILVFRTINPQQKLLPTDMLGLPWITSLRKDASPFKSYTNKLHLCEMMSQCTLADWSVGTKTCDAFAKTMLLEIHQSKVLWACCWHVSMGRSIRKYLNKYWMVFCGTFTVLYHILNQSLQRIFTGLLNVASPAKPSSGGIVVQTFTNIAICRGRGSSRLKGALCI